MFNGMKTADSYLYLHKTDLMKSNIYSNRSLYNVCRNITQLKFLKNDNTEENQGQRL